MFTTRPLDFPVGRFPDGDGNRTRCALLLDDEFMHAYEFGIVIEFADGILRRVFPRLFTYSADYPEK